MGSILSLFPNNDIIFLVGRFTYGLANGSFAVFVLKYMNETTPLEIKGSVGVSAELALTFGQMMIFLLDGLYITRYPVIKMDDTDLLLYIRIVYSVPIVISVLQLFLLEFIFPYDTPVMLYIQNDKITLYKLLNNIYKENIFHEKLEQLKQDLSGYTKTPKSNTLI